MSGGPSPFSHSHCSPVCRVSAGCGPPRSRRGCWVKVQAPPPAAPSLGCFSEANTPQYCPAPTSSSISGCRAPPGGGGTWDPEAAGEGPELKGLEPPAGARDVAPSRDKSGKWCPGCLWGRLPKVHPHLPTVPHWGRLGGGSGGGPGTVGLSWAAAQVYPVVPALLLMRISARGLPRQLAALPRPMCSRGAHQCRSLCPAF